MSDAANDVCVGCVVLITLLTVSYLIISAIGLEGYVTLIVTLFLLYTLFRPRKTGSSKSGDKVYVEYSNGKNQGGPIDKSLKYISQPPEIPYLPGDLIIDSDPENRGRYIETVNKLIETLTDSEESSYKSQAAVYLGETGDAIAVKPLIDAKGDPNENVKQSVSMALKKIKATQKDLIKNYETLICENDFFRPIKIYLSEGEFVECRVCGHSKFLQKGVEEVIGFIGDQEYSRRDGKRLFINLWDQETKKARNADIDALWIIQSESIDYGWAISAVVQTLKNDITRQKKLKEIPVTIKGNPEIPDEETEILKELFAEVRFEI